MIVCVCNAIREDELRAAARQGATEPLGAYASLGCEPLEQGSADPPAAERERDRLLDVLPLPGLGEGGGEIEDPRGVDGHGSIVHPGTDTFERLFLRFSGAQTASRPAADADPSQV